MSRAPAISNPLSWKSVSRQMVIALVVLTCVAVLQAEEPTANKTVADPAGSQERNGEDSALLSILKAFGFSGPVVDPELRAPTNADELRRRLQSPRHEVRQRAVYSAANLAREADKVVPVLIAVVKDESETSQQRQAAMHALGKLGSTASEAVPDLVRFLEHEQLGWSAAFALEKVGGPAVPALTEILEQRTADPETYYRVMHTIERIGPAANSAVPVLRELLADNRLGSSAAAALVKMGGSAAPTIAEALAGRDKNGRSLILSALRNAERFPEGVEPALIDILYRGQEWERKDVRKILATGGPSTASYLASYVSGSNLDLRMRVIQTLKDMGPKAAPAVSGLREALDDGNVTIRLLAADALSKIGASAASAVPALVSHLNDTDPTVRVAVCEALAAIGEGAVDPLIEVVNDPTVGSTAVNVLEQIGAPAASRLLQLQISNDATLRDVAGDLLAKIGSGGVDPIAEALEDENPQVRRWAAFALGRCGAKAARPLARAMQHGDGELQMLAADALGKLGPNAKAAVPQLLAALSSPDERVRIVAVEALGAVGPGAKEAVESLAATLEDRVLRSRAAEALASIGEASVPVLVGMLDDQNADVRHAVVFALGRTGTNRDEAISALIANLKSSDEATRLLAADALGRIGESAVPLLCEAIDDPEMPERWLAALALGKMGPQAKAASEPLATALRAEDQRLQSAAAVALGQIGKAAEDAIPALKDSLHTVTGEARMNVATALWEISEHPWGIEVLEQTLKDRDAYVRVASANALGRIGVKAKSATPALAAAIDDESEEVQAAAAKALGQIGPDARSALESLRASLHHVTGMTRLNVAWAIWQIAEDPWGPQVLAQTLEDKNPAIRYASAVLLSRMGKRAKVATSALTVALEDRRSNVRAAAAIALAQIGADAKASAPGLTKALSTSVGESRLNTAFALWRVSEDESVVQDLAEGLEDPDANVRCGAAAALAQMGPKAEEAVPSLVAALRDDDEDVRVMVAAALGQIGNKAAVAMPALLVAVKGDSDKVRQRAASAMLAVPEKFYVAIPPLVRAMEDEGPTVRRTVAEALVGKPDGDEKPVPVDRLTRTLRNDRRVETRCSAALLLAVRQQEADQVVGDLQYAFDNDQDNYVRWCAKWALSVLRPGSVDN